MLLFFCTDIHGSDKLWRKFLSTQKYYGATLLVLGGDIMGKGLVAVHRRNGGYWTDFLGEELHAGNDEELAEMDRKIRTHGMYPVVVQNGDVERWRSSPAAYDDAFREAVTASLQRWLEEAARRKEERTTIVVTCGNDDPHYLDPILAASPTIVFAEERVIDIGDGFTMLNLGWSNPTPWDTHREYPEEVLAARIEELAKDIPDMQRAIFNIHVPPYNTRLDEGPVIDAEMRAQPGQSASLGSTAVREAIQRYQPLLSLHGHIHESRGMMKLGKTLCINPGSSYTEGVLQGILVELDKKKGIRSHLPTQG